jgi:hypothetical protein
VIAAVIHEGRVVTLRGDLSYQAGDEVLVVMDNQPQGTFRWLLTTG